MLALAKDKLGSLPVGVRWFLVTESLFGIGAGLLNLILNLHLLAVGIDEATIGQITSLGALTTGVLSIPAGFVVQRFGRKQVLTFGMTLGFLGMLAFGLGSSVSVAVAGQLLWSVGMTAVVTSEIQLLFQYCKEKREETTAYSLLFAVFTLFTGVGTLLGGFLPDWIGGVLSHYQYTFFVGAAFMGLSALLRGLYLPQTFESRTSGRTGSQKPADPKQKRTAGRLVLILCLVMLNGGFNFGFLGSYLNVIAKYRFDWTDEQVSVLMTALGFCLFVGSLFMPYMLHTFGVRKSIGGLFMANIVLVLLLAAALPPALFSVLLVLRGGSFMMLSNMLDSEAMSAVPEQSRNSFAGLRTVSRSAGNALAALWSGYILARADYMTPFLLTAISLAIGWVSFRIWVMPMLEERHREEEADPSGSRTLEPDTP